MMLHKFAISALIVITPHAATVACDPAQEVSTNLDQQTCSAGEEKHVEFTNVAPITYTLPPAPKVECGITYAILGGSAVTFSGGKLGIKGDGQPVSTSLVRTNAGTGRLVWNGLHWVHIGGG